LSVMASGASAGDQLAGIAGLGLFCLKDKLADGTPVYCVQEVYNFEVSMPTATPITGAQIAATLTIACRTRCLAKYFYFVQAFAQGPLIARAETAVVFEFICNKNPTTNQFCLATLSPPTGLTCASLATFTCDANCKAYLAAQIAAAGCCFTTNLKFFIILLGQGADLGIAITAIETFCQITLPPTCGNSTLDKVTFSVTVTNLNSVSYSSNSATYRTVVLADICTTLGCVVADVAFVASVTNSDGTITITWTWYTSNGVAATSTFSTDVPNTPLTQTNANSPSSSYNDVTEPVTASSGSATVTPAPSSTKSSATISTPFVAIVLALVAFVLSL